MPPKPKQQQSPDEKRLAKIAGEIKVSCNRARSQFSFGRIKTYRELLECFNYPPSYGPEDKLNDAIDFEFVKRFINEQEDRFSLTLKLWRENVLPQWQMLPAKWDAVYTYVAKPVVAEQSAPIAVNGESLAASEDVATAMEEDELADDAHWREFFKSPKQRAILYTKQFRAAGQIYTNLRRHKHKANLLIAGTGVGKTWMYGSLIRKLKDEGFFKGLSTPWPCMVITKASIVSQTEQVLEQEFGLDIAGDIHVLNIEQLRSKLGKMFIKEVVNIIDGIEYINFEWMPFCAPKLIIWDECQILKNTDTTQSRIAQGYNDLDPAMSMMCWNGEQSFQLFSSATPFIKVAEAKVFCTSTGVGMSFGMGGSVEVSNRNWTDFARQIADPSKPTDLNQAAVERLMTVMAPYVVDVKNVRPQFRAINKITMIDFKNATEQKRYDDAWETYQQAKAAIEQRAYARGTEPSNFEKLATFTIFTGEAEDIRAEWTADRAIELIKQGYAPVIACRYKRTIVSINKFLHEKYGMSRSRISIIWGGIGKSVSAAKRQQLDKLDDASFKQMLDDEGLDLKDFGIDIQKTKTQVALENDPFIKYFQLGPQSAAERNRERIRFQKGQSDVMIFTFKAGGVGLSVHHCDDYMPPERKIRRRASGFAYVEDIPKVTSKPRYVILTPVYSAIELVQGLGRGPRLTSLSDTQQEMVFYRGTIEEAVAANVGTKLRCLKKVVRQRESWEDMIYGAKFEDGARRLASQIPDTERTTVIDAEEDGNIYELGSEAENEDEDTNESKD